MENNKKIKNLFKYLNELKKRIDTNVLNYSEYDWFFDFSLLPTSTQFVRIDYESDSLLRIVRPKEIHCPKPSEKLLKWIKNDWSKLENKVELHKNISVLKADKSVEIHMFEEQHLLKIEFKEWSKRRDEWISAELPNQYVRKIFDQFYALKAKLDRESEKLELLIGNGIVEYNNPIRKVNHPIVLKKVSLVFEPSENEPYFEIVKSDSEPFLYTDIIRETAGNLNGLKAVKTDFDAMPTDPDNIGEVDSLSKKIANTFWPNHIYLNDLNLIDKENDKVYVSNKLLLILGKKNDHFSEQIESYINKLETMSPSELPVSLRNIIGDYDSSKTNFNEDNNGTSKKTNKSKYYLTKAYNQEQKRIINSLNTNGCVSVQGPPGTGKSHTIANIIGHLLAEGQRVLVSSYTTKALNVIREKVVDELRPLCVSVLDQDSLSKGQLEESVAFINNILLNHELPDLIKKIETLGVQKNKIESELNQLRNKYVESIHSEYLPINYMNQAVIPLEAGKLISSITHELIQGPFLSELSPLTDEQYSDLLNLQDIVPIDDYNMLSIQQPSTEIILEPNEFKHLIDLRESYTVSSSHVDKKYHETIKNIPISNANIFIKDLEDLAEKLDSVSFEYGYTFGICLKGSEFRSYILECIYYIKERIAKINKNEILLFKYSSNVTIDTDIKKLMLVVNDIILKKNFNRSKLQKIINSNTEKLINSCTVNNKQPETQEEYEGLLAYLETLHLKNEIFLAWKSCFVDRLNFGVIDSIQTITELINQVENVVHVSEKAVEIKELVTKKNIYFESFETEFIDLDKLKNEISIKVLPAFNLLFEKNLLDEMKNKFSESLDYINNFETDLTKKIANSIVSFSFEEYNIYYAKIKELESKKAHKDRIDDYISKIQDYNKYFSNLVFNYNNNRTIVSFNEFWKASYLNWYIENVNSTDLSLIKSRINKLQVQLEKLNIDLIQSLTAAEQIKRTDNVHRTALISWMQLQNSMSKNGKGKLDSSKKREAKKLIKLAQEAVPVWIMPLSKVFDNFKISEDQFDVLIIDEASQADLTYLPLLAIAKKVIVVGDDKQVSPSAAGKNLDGLEPLMDEYLGEFASKINFNYKYSIFDIASAFFGEKIQLSEHFRCVPSIIQFSNDLSYDGRIKVLRETNSSNLQPGIIPYYVKNAVSEGNVNIIEAETIVATIKSMIKDERYKDKTIGVISLKGPRQHQEIDNLIKVHMSPAEIEKHKILCGKAPQFQGDERDVVLISLVDAPENFEDVLTLVSDTEDRKKEFNVAVSRARDQLWVFHSMSMQNHLKSGDIRLRLLKHAVDPSELSKKYSQSIKLAESEFEKSVHNDLIRNHLNFTAQYEVGAYRIDIVLHGPDGLRVALECDGDKFHSTDEQVRNDLDRQAILERLGFKFIRVRGSDYYRRNKETVEKMINDLKNYGILPDYKITNYNTQNDSDLNDLFTKINEMYTATFKSNLNIEDSQQVVNLKAVNNFKPSVEKSFLLNQEEDNLELEKLIPSAYAVDSNDIYSLEDIVNSSSYEEWMMISKIQSLTNSQRSLSYSIGKNLKEKKKNTLKQCYWASRILVDLVESEERNSAWIEYLLNIDYQELIKLMKESGVERSSA